MIELLKYLANNLEPEQLLEVAHIVSQNPDMIDQETFISIIRDNSALYKLLKDNNISLN